MRERVLFQDCDLVPRLHQLRAPKDVLLDVLDRAAGERANVTVSDPGGTAGTEMRRWSTRFLRDDDRLKELGWTPCSHSQVDGIRNDRLRMKIAFMNTNACTGMPSKAPQSVAEKGSLTELFIQRNCDSDQLGLFGEEPDQFDPIARYDFWYLCAYVSDRHIAAELSRPTGLKNGLVFQYSERLILWQPGEKEGLHRPHSVLEDFAEIELPTLKRKN